MPQKKFQYKRVFKYCFYRRYRKKKLYKYKGFSFFHSKSSAIYKCKTYTFTYKFLQALWEHLKGSVSTSAPTSVQLVNSVYVISNPVYTFKPKSFRGINLYINQLYEIILLILNGYQSLCFYLLLSYTNVVLII